MSIKTSKDKNNPWKKKAVARNLKIKERDKRISELILSRDLWKSKYKNRAKCDSIHLNDSKAFGHHYPVQLVLLMVLWQEYGQMSLRAVRHCFVNLQLVFIMNCRVPSHVSIRNWACKSGYHRIQKEQNTVFDKTQEWVFIIDESISMGSEKILLILGLPINEWSFSKSLTKEDVRVMSVQVDKEWKAEQINEQLETLRKTHNVTQVVCDNGNNLKKALKLASLAHVPDCTHLMANALAHQYQKDEGYLALSGGAGALRKKWFLSKKVIYIPPVQRTKARFQNIFPTIEWARGILLQWEHVPADVKTELAFVKQQESLVEEMFEQISILLCISKILKNKGLNQDNKEQIELIMDFLTTRSGLSIKEEISDYLNSLSPLLKNGKTILCCSDIIESYFGKFKNKINPKSPNGMTEFVLTIANFGVPFEKEEIKEALEKVKCIDMKSWVKNKASLTQQKQKIFEQSGTKKAA
jgi:hypothetical protein